jgi:hypothetical protein
MEAIYPIVNAVFIDALKKAGVDNYQSFSSMAYHTILKFSVKNVKDY